MINTREVATEYRLSHWSQIMQERSASGLSIKAYCESIGLRQNVYHYWQRKLREAAVTATMQPDCLPTPSGWAVCKTKESDRKDEPAIQIDIGKSRITVHAGTDQAFLEKVCRTLMSLC
jgi:hypothetical protein